MMNGENYNSLSQSQYKWHRFEFLTNCTMQKSEKACISLTPLNSGQQNYLVLLIRVTIELVGVFKNCMQYLYCRVGGGRGLLKSVSYNASSSDT